MDLCRPRRGMQHSLGGSTLGRGSRPRSLCSGLEPPSMLDTRSHRKSACPSASLTIPELEQSKINVLATLPSAHSRRTYRYAIERFIESKGSLIGIAPNLDWGSIVVL